MPDQGMGEPAEIASIVDVTRLNNFMSSPRWTDAQADSAVDILEGIEDTLAGKLNSPIKPIPYRETVTVLRSGQVNTTYPVAGITSINGAAPVNGVLPTGWRVQDHRLYADLDAGVVSASLYGGVPFTLGGFPGRGEVGRVDGIGSVTVDYMAGWGNVPALRLAILKKAANLFNDMHDDSISTRDLDGSEAPRKPKPEWTAAELADLELFRNLVAWR